MTQSTIDGGVCPHCRSIVPRGAHVCVGCQGEVVYGATSDERGRGALFGAIAGVALSVYFQVPIYIGVVFVVSGLIGGGMVVDKMHAGEVRVFRSYRTR